MKKIVLGIGLLVCVGVAYGLYAFRGVAPALLPVKEVTGDEYLEQPEKTEGSVGVNNTDLPLAVPKGFVFDTITDKVPNARVLQLGPEGNLWVSRPQDGSISFVHPQDQSVGTPFVDLKRPHGIAFDIQDPSLLYIATEDTLYKTRIASEAPLEKILELPGTGRHYTRTLFFGPDNELYISIGSTCDVCTEADERHAAVLRVDLENNTLEPFATGLRNAVFADIHPVTGDIWVTEMGRDRLGDDLPPDEINILQKDGWYGWPWFYGQNVFDEDFADGVMPGFAKEAIPSHIDLPAHVAPLGIAFVPEEGWPEDMWYDALIALHGSWNRTDPVGYSVVQIPLDANGNPEYDQDGHVIIKEFLSGWLDEGRSYGRPVDLLIQPGGTLYISDDKGGRIYRLSLEQEVR